MSLGRTGEKLGNPYDSLDWDKILGNTTDISNKRRDAFYFLYELNNDISKINAAMNPRAGAAAPLAPKDEIKTTLKEVFKILSNGMPIDNLLIKKTEEKYLYNTCNTIKDEEIPYFLFIYIIFRIIKKLIRDSITGVGGPLQPLPPLINLLGPDQPDFERSNKTAIDKIKELETTITKFIEKMEKYCESKTTTGITTRVVKKIIKKYSNPQYTAIVDIILNEKNKQKTYSDLIEIVKDDDNINKLSVIYAASQAVQTPVSIANNAMSVNTNLKRNYSQYFTYCQTHPIFCNGDPAHVPPILGINNDLDIMKEILKHLQKNPSITSKEFKKFMDDKILPKLPGLSANLMTEDKVRIKYFNNYLSLTRSTLRFWYDELDTTKKTLVKDKLERKIKEYMDEHINEPDNKKIDEMLKPLIANEFADTDVKNIDTISTKYIEDILTTMAPGYPYLTTPENMASMVEYGEKIVEQKPNINEKLLTDLLQDEINKRTAPALAAAAPIIPLAKKPAVARAAAAAAATTAAATTAAAQAAATAAAALAQAEETRAYEYENETIAAETQINSILTSMNQINPLAQNLLNEIKIVETSVKNESNEAKNILRTAVNEFGTAERTLKRFKSETEIAQNNYNNERLSTVKSRLKRILLMKKSQESAGENDKNDKEELKDKAELAFNDVKKAAETADDLVKEVEKTKDIFDEALILAGEAAAEEVTARNYAGHARHHAENLNAALGVNPALIRTAATEKEKAKKQIKIAEEKANEVNLIKLIIQLKENISKVLEKIKETKKNLSDAAFSATSVRTIVINAILNGVNGLELNCSNALQEIKKLEKQANLNKKSLEKARKLIEDLVTSGGGFKRTKKLKKINKIKKRKTLKKNKINNK